MCNKFLLRSISIVFILCTYSNGGKARSLEDGQHLELSISGTLISPPVCEINHNKNINISFGSDVVIQKIKNGSYSQKIPLDVTCSDENIDDWMMEISVSGPPAGFDLDGATLASAEQDNLGVKIYIDETPMVLNRWFTVDPLSFPTLRAVVAMREGATLREGNFRVMGTLKVEYH